MRRFSLVVLVGLLFVPMTPARADCTRIGTITLGECKSKQHRHRTHQQPSDPALDVAAEHRLLELANEARADRGLRPLTPDPRARKVARRHTRRMFEDGRVYHNQNLDSPETRRRMGYPSDIAENVGYGPSAESLHAAFMDSDRHRANILGSYTRAGFGAVTDGHNVWVTQVFVRGGSEPQDQAGDRFGAGAFGAQRHGPADPSRTLIPALPDSSGGILGLRDAARSSAPAIPWGWMGAIVGSLSVPGLVRGIKLRRRLARWSA